jgi:hypothetical protein
MRRPMALALVCLVLVAACTPNERIDAGRRPATARPIASPSVPSPEPLGRSVRWESRGTPIGFGHGLFVLGQEISVRAFPLRCRRPCEPAFTTGLHTYDPVLVRDDVAYVGTDRGVAILSLGCSGVWPDRMAPVQRCRRPVVRRLPRRAREPVRPGRRRRGRRPCAGRVGWSGGVGHLPLTARGVPTRLPAYVPSGVDVPDGRGAVATGCGRRSRPRPSDRTRRRLPRPLR